MARTWHFLLLLCALPTVSRCLSLSSDDNRTVETQQGMRSSGDHGLSGDHGPSGDHGSTLGSGNVPHSDEGASGGHHEGGNLTTLPIVTWKWEHVSEPYLVALWILVSWLCKLIIEANHRVTNVIPESALLIGFGFILGGIVLGADHVQTFKLSPKVFFFYLLPQIILDTGYSMPNKLFFSNLGGILVYAVVGTCWNAATLGLSLWGCHKGGAMGDLDIGLLQYLLFGSLIAAVDPVAVIAVFEQVHVNEVLFIMVFGESLLNDGVTVVLFNVFDAFVTLGGERINAAEIIKGIISFFVVAFGGSLVGLVFGILISLLTRCTKNVQIIEGGFIFVLGYLSYLTAEMLSLSAILSIVFCGISCQKYVNANMDQNSVNTVRHAMKVFANGSETIIFVFLGISAVDTTIWVWNTGFILLTLLFIMIYRFIGTFFLTWILNKHRLVPIGFIDQVIMSYGGLRGAVAYGLAVLLDENKIKEKNLMLSTTLIVVYFTVILQGITMKPLVTWLNVKKASTSERTLIEKMQNKVFDHMLIAIEDISGQIGHNYMRDKWNKFEEKWMMGILMKPSVRKEQEPIFSVFHELNLKDAMSYVAEGERKGSLEFIRNDTAIVDFEKKFGDEFSEVMSDFMAHTANKYDTLSNMRDPVPSVSLEIHEQTMKGIRGTEDFNSHHLLEQHLYKGRKQHRHRYSRNHFDVNTDEGEVQEIFQRTMRSRLESFKSAKMGVSPPKPITKQTRKDQQHQMPNGKPLDPSRTDHSGDADFDFSEGDSASGYDATGTSIPMRTTYTTGAGIENPAFIPDLDHMAPWLVEPELESSTIPPPQRAQMRMMWRPSDLHRQLSAQSSTQSTHSAPLAEDPAAQQRDDEQLPTVAPPPYSGLSGHK